MERANEADTRPRRASAVAAAATDGGRSIAAEASNRLRSAEEDAASYLRADQSATGESGAADVKDKN